MIVIDDIRKKYVRKFTTEAQTTFYAVSISVCRAMSSDGFVTYVCDDEHIKLENRHYVLTYEEDIERTFKIADKRHCYTTAQLTMSEVAQSHIDAVAEREAERQAAHLEELKKALFNSRYFTLHTSDGLGDKAVHSYNSIKDVDSEVRTQVYKMLDVDLCNDIIRKGQGKYDLEIYEDNGYLVIRRTTYKRNAFANVHNGEEYSVNEVKELKYFVRNDNRIRCTVWDWSDVLEDIHLKQITNNTILTEERTDEQWEKAIEIAQKNVKCSRFDVLSMSKNYFDQEDLQDDPDELMIQELLKNRPPEEPKITIFKPIEEEKNNGSDQVDEQV